MAYSSLCKKIIESPNNSGKRSEKLRIITPHIIVGQASMDTLGRIFSKPERSASSNYGVCVDGIVGIVDEDNRSWCSSSSWNDNRAITIEVASDKTHPYRVDDEIFSSLVDLCVDICKRHGFNKVVSTNTLDEVKTLLKTTPDTTCILSRHSYYANKSCPGEYLGSKFEELARLVTERISSSEKPEVPDKDKDVLYKVRINGFTSKSTAVKFLAGLKTMGINCFLLRNSDGTFGIQLGAYNNEENAVKQVANLQGKIGKMMLSIVKE